jgi:hypothetical protein
MGVSYSINRQAAAASLLHPMAFKKKLVMWSAIVLAVLFTLALYISSSSAGSPQAPLKNAQQLNSAVQAEPQASKSDGSESESEAAGSQSDTSTNVTSGDNSSSMNITVNGQNVPVPQNGSVDKTIPAGNGQGSTHVSVESNNSTSGNNSSSRLHVSTRSSSHSTSSSSNSDIGGGL